MESITKKASAIRLAIFDIDGVFTDGKLYYNERGEQSKAFNVQDGVGVKLLQRSGVKVAIITAKTSAIIETRSAQLGIEHVYQGYEIKLPAYEKILKQLKVTDREICYVGDDLPDLPIMQRVGLSIAVGNAVAIVQEHADCITNKTGGHGAVREICEFIMRSQDTLQRIQASFYVE